ncbi:hypothetical protein D3OALGB2SA_3660 [Olavius algarvensis associated proteobacterium Delta 3]|nr:hypothetical protein D3OALGB2SA_3660 [Olavius algarvensis associated proteobacterium Delta 3]
MLFRSERGMMPTHIYQPARRFFLTTFLAGSTWGLLGFPGLVTRLLAMGARDFPQGVQKLQGNVFINGRPAALGDLVGENDVVTTGPDAMVVFVIGQGVYLLRDNSRFELNHASAGGTETGITDLIRLYKGKMLGVFSRKQRKQIFTSTAVLGIRGSGAYVESEVSRSYVCLCYGRAKLTANAEPAIIKKLSTHHHEAPRFIYSSGEKLIRPAPVFNHTDAELIMLEALVGRKPPFVRQGGGGNGGGNGGGGY